MVNCLAWGQAAGKVCASTLIIVCCVHGCWADVSAHRPVERAMHGLWDSEASDSAQAVSQFSVRRFSCSSWSEEL